MRTKFEPGLKPSFRRAQQARKIAKLESSRAWTNYVVFILLILSNRIYVQWSGLVYLVIEWALNKPSPRGASSFPSFSSQPYLHQMNRASYWPKPKIQKKKMKSNLTYSSNMILNRCWTLCYFHHPWPYMPRIFLEINP